MRFQTSNKGNELVVLSSPVGVCCLLLLRVLGVSFVLRLWSSFESLIYNLAVFVETVVQIGFLNECT